jgi:FKBP-type peptidyl-prolyl cis-trans isomerase FkpA
MKFTALVFGGLLILALAVANAEPAAPSAAPAKAPETTKPDAKPEGKPAAKKKAKKDEKSAGSAKSASGLPKEIKTLVVEDTSVGKGKVATKGKTIKVNYTGWIYDSSKPKGHGAQIDTSEGKEPFSFTLGAKQVIPGWDEGFKDMKVGGKRRLLIPSDMAYGSRGAGQGVVPPSSALVFEVELLEVQ